MEFQITAKGQLFRSLSSWYFPSVNCSGWVRQRWCWLARVLKLYCETLVRWADCVLSRGAVPLTPAWDRTHNSENPGEKPPNFSTPPTFLCMEKKEKAQRGEKSERERVINEKQTQGRIWYGCSLLGRWCNKPNQRFFFSLHSSNSTCILGYPLKE